MSVLLAQIRTWNVHVPATPSKSQRESPSTQVCTRLNPPRLSSSGSLAVLSIDHSTMQSLTGGPPPRMCSTLHVGLQPSPTTGLASSHCLAAAELGDAVAADEPGLRNASAAAPVAALRVAVVAALDAVDHAVAAHRCEAARPAGVGGGVVVGGPVVALLAAPREGDAVAADVADLDVAARVAIVTADVVAVVALLAGVHDTVAARRRLTGGATGVRQDVAVGRTLIAAFAGRVHDAVAATGVRRRRAGERMVALMSSLPSMARTKRPSGRGLSAMIWVS